MNFIVKVFCLLFTGLLFTPCTSADIKGSGSLKFRPDQHGEVLMELNQFGLGIGTSPSANLHIKGNLAYNYQVVSANTTLSNNTFILVDSSSDNLTLTLPYAGNVDGHIYKIKKTSSLHFVSVLDGDPTSEQEYLFPPSAAEDSLPYAEFFSASNSWHLMTRDGLSTSWNPLASSNITVWLDASDTSSITSSSGNVTQWNDKSGNDYHVVQNTDDNHPQTGTRTINNINGVDFDGTNDSLKYSADFFTSDQSYTKVIIYFIDTTAKPNNTLTIGNSAFYNEFTIFHAGTQVSASSYPGISTPMIIIGTYESGVRADLYINGVNVGSNTTPPGAWANNSSNFQVGAYGAGNHLDGVLGEALIFNHDVSSDTRTKIEGYLAWKWGLRNVLSDSHPYKNSPPSK